jgi:hypothetical protein
VTENSSPFDDDIRKGLKRRQEMCNELHTYLGGTFLEDSGDAIVMALIHVAAQGSVYLSDESFEEIVENITIIFRKYRKNYHEHQQSNLGGQSGPGPGDSQH